MTKRAAEQAQDLEVFLAEANPGTDPNEASRTLTTIRRYANELHRIYENQCNGYRNAMLEKLDERREKELVEKLNNVFSRYGLKLFLQSDPRGNPVGIMTPKTGRYNTMGGAEDGWRL